MEIIEGVLDIPLTVLLLVPALLLLYRYLTRNFSVWSSQGVPGPKPVIILGNTYQLLKERNFVYVDQDYVKTYGKKVGVYAGDKPQLLIAEPELVRQSFIKDFNSMPNRVELRTGSPIIDNFMTVLNNEHWKHVRSRLSPTFTSGKLKHMKTLIDSCTDRLVKSLMKRQGEQLDAKKVSGAYTMDVIASTAFGIEVDSHGNPDQPIIQHANELMNSGSAKITTWNKIKNVLKMIIFTIAPSWMIPYLIKLGISIMNPQSTDYFQSLTEQIIQSTDDSSSEKQNFVQLCKSQLISDPVLGDDGTLVDDHGNPWSTSGLTKSEIVSNAILFFLAGYETTANTLNYTMYELALDQTVQDKVYAEIKEHGLSDKPKYEELMKLGYLDQVIDEALRLYPPAPRIDRLVARKTELDGISIPAGSMVSACTYAIHHDPEIWPDPFKFDPDRFSVENKEGRHSCAWIPFGTGNRNCIGMRLALLELKLALVNLIHHFRIETCEETVEKPMKFKRNFQLQPETPITLVVKPRE